MAPVEPRAIKEGDKTGILRRRREQTAKPREETKEQ